MKVAIIGCGHVLDRHVRALRRVTGVELAALCDREPGRARQAARSHGVPKAFEDLDELLAWVGPESVHVLTPPATHADLALRAMKAGAHVLVEKPMAVDPDAAEAMIDAARRNGVRLGVCHNFLFEPVVLEARERVAAGAIGRIVQVEIFWRVLDPGGRYRDTGWIGELRGGPLHEVAPHPLSLIDGLLGELRVLSAVARGGDGISSFDGLHVQLAGDTALASLSISLGARPHQVWVRIYGTRRTLILDLATNTLVRLRMPGTGRARKLLRNLDHAAQLGLGTALGAVRRAAGRMTFGHARLIEEHYGRLGAGREPPVSGEDGARVVRLLDEVWGAVGLAAPEAR